MGTKLMNSRDDVATVYGPLLETVFNKYAEYEDFPEILYHYTSNENFKKIVQNKSLRLNLSENLIGDKREIEHAKDLTKLVINEQILKKNNTEFWNNFLNDFGKIDIFNFYIFSMTEKYNDEYMWNSRYGDHNDLAPKKRTLS
jgi:hypothetical protein